MPTLRGGYYYTPSIETLAWPQEAGGGWWRLVFGFVLSGLFFLLSAIVFCLQLSTNHLILTILVLSGFHSDRFAGRSLGVSPPGDPLLRTHLKSQIFYCLHYSVLRIDFNYWLSIVGNQLHEFLRSKGSLYTKIDTPLRSGPTGMRSC